MHYRRLSNSALALAMTLLLPSAHSQNAKGVLNLSDDEIRKFVETTVDQGFPQSRADQMTMLVINKSAVVVPVLENRIEEMLKSPAPQQKAVDIASEMIAYAGNEQSLEATSSLLAIDPKRFGKLVGRILDNAMNYRNPFTVAYNAFDLGDEGIAQAVVSWCDSALATDRMKRRWAQAMVDRYGKVPNDTEWTSDPLASRLPGGEREQLKQKVIRFVSEEQDKRGKQ